MLPYIFIPKLIFDQDSLNNIVSSTIGNLINRNDISIHRKIRVSNHPLLMEFRSKYPIIGDIINVYMSEAGGNIPPHQDASRNCAINFPIKETLNSNTIFYETIGEPKYTFNRVFIWNTPINELREVYRFTLTEPVIINNSLIHGVEHLGPRSRVIASWSILPQYSFEDAVKFFKQYPHEV